MKLLRVEATQAAFPERARSFSKTLRKLEKFVELKRGWRLGQGLPVPVHVVSIGKRVATELQLSGFPQSDAFPGANSDILVTGYWGDNYVGITVDQTGLLTLNYERGDKPVLFVEHLPFASAVENLKRIAGEIWNTSASFSRATSIISRAGSTTWRSKPTTTGYHASKQSAPLRIVAAFAST